MWAGLAILFCWIDRATGSVDRPVVPYVGPAEIAAATTELDELTHQDEALTSERATATPERQAAIDAQLKANQARAAKLVADRWSAQGELPEDARRRRENLAQIAALEAELGDVAARVADVHVARPERGARFTLWSDAVSSARKSLRESGLPNQVRAALDELKTLTGKLDARFVEVAREVERSLYADADPDAAAVRALGWEFARALTGLQATVSRLLDPGGEVSTAMGAARRQLQATLAALAGFLAQRFLIRAGLIPQ